MTDRMVRLSIPRARLDELDPIVRAEIEQLVLEGFEEAEPYDPPHYPERLRFEGEVVQNPVKERQDRFKRMFRGGVLHQNPPGGS